MRGTDEKGDEIDERVWTALRGTGSLVPKGYVDFCIMREMGWTYQELQACPQRVYEDIMRYMRTENKFREWHGRKS